MPRYEYIKVYYKGGYYHYYLTNDVNSFKRDPEVEKVEYIEIHHIKCNGFNICNDED